MKMFVRTNQYHSIKNETRNMLNGHAMTNDMNVLEALKSLAVEKVIGLFPHLTEEQLNLLKPIREVRDQGSADRFLMQLKPFVIPFKMADQQALKKLFPKVKKLKALPLENIDLQETTYLAWDDAATGRRYLLFESGAELKGLLGTFKPATKKGICALCNKHEAVGLFLIEKKGAALDTYTTRGNYICVDSIKCSQHITTQEKLADFAGSFS